MSIFDRALIVCLFAGCSQVCAQNVKTEGSCSPVVQNQGGTTNVTIECGLDLSPSALAIRNLRATLDSLRGLGQEQMFYFLPGLEEYSESPTLENWQIVKVELERTQKALQAAIDTSIRYFATIKYGNHQGAELAEILRQRGVALSKLDNAERIAQQKNASLVSLSKNHLRAYSSPPRDIDKWTSEYRELMKRLSVKIVEMEEALAALEAATKESREAEPKPVVSPSTIFPTVALYF